MSQRNAGSAGAPDTGERDTPPQEPERADRRRLAIVAAIAAVLAVLSFVLVGGRHAAAGLGPHVLQYTVLTGNVLLLFALSFYLLRYLVRLFAARKAGILGSRFKFKLVVTFIALCLVPALVLYVVAILLLSEAVDRSFSPNVEAILLDGQAVAAQFTGDAEAALSGEMRNVAASLAAGAPASPQHRDDISALLASEMRARHLAAARVYFRGGDQPVQVDDSLASGGKRSPLDPTVLPAREFEQDLARALAGGRFARTVWSEGMLYVVAGAGVTVPGQLEPAAAVVAARRIPADLARRVERLRDAAEEHQRQREARPWLKAEQALLFLGFSVVIILGATWVGLTIARSITVPIQRLAEGTAEIGRGNLGHVVQWEGKDELAILVGAFNDMSRDLKVKAEEVARKTDEIQGANEALHRANLEIAQSRDRMERLLQTMAAGVIAIDSAGRVSVANRAAHQILEVPDERGPGLHHAEFLAGESLAELRQEVAHSLGRDGLRRSREMTVASGRGPVHLQVVLTSQPETEGEGVGLLAVFEDVTELVRAQKLATWETVARRIAHEIKNPLTPIQLSAQRILKKFREGSSEFGEALESGIGTITAEVAGLKQMVDEFSRFARMPEVQPVPGDLNAMLRSVAELYRGHESLELELELAADLPAVPYDPEQLRRAVVNLVDNAVEATLRRGTVTLRTEVAPSGRHVRLVVADDGPGVPAADREKLFLPYFTTKRRGTGLGLAIVHRIVSDHQGRVRVEENRPRGARFVVELPLAGAAAAPAGERGAR